MCLTLNCAEILHSIYQYRQNMWSLKDNKNTQRCEERPSCFDPQKNEKYTYEILVGKPKG
jgi:hypothetical protein